MELFLSFIVIIPLILFGYWFYFRPTSLWTGFFFLVALTDLAAIFIIMVERYSQQLALLLVLPGAVLLAIIALIGIYAMIIGLFWNERVLLKYERLSFSNLLPLIIATLLILFQIALFSIPRFVDNRYALALFAFVTSAYTYFGLVFLLYGLTAILYNLFPIRKKVDYIIVLGAGLNKDKVTPLLASRIEAGVKLYRRQVNKLNNYPTIILSGGQGSDELISEAQAMNNYLQEHHPDIQQVYLESKSTNTFENLNFSEEVAIQNDNIPNFKEKAIVLASNNYHLLRAGKHAHSLGLNVRGIGSPTRLYYLPTAFMREYIGYLLMSKKNHIYVLIFFAVLTFVPLLFT